MMPTGLPVEKMTVDCGAVANGLDEKGEIPVARTVDVLFENTNPLDLVYGRWPDEVGMTTAVEVMVDKTPLEYASVGKGAVGNAAWVEVEFA